jgi:hypothetical protein
MGIRKPVVRTMESEQVKARHAPAAPGPAVDTARLSRSVRNIPATGLGVLLGNLEGVRCSNCAPGLVELGLADSVAREAVVLTLRSEIWNAVERPLRDRRMYDHENHCVHFGFKALDTAFVGGELTEIHVREVPCYPYVRRVRMPAAGPALQAASPSPVPAAADSAASRLPPQARQVEPE